MTKILVTGGAGYIGSHTILGLLTEGYEVVAVDSLSNSSRESLARVEKISGKKIELHVFDLRNKLKLNRLFSEHDIDGVVHFAGLKAVGESVSKPLEYYDNNIGSTLNLCEVMQKHGVKKLIFSSSATVYGTPSELPLKETSRVGVGITNPYGQTKFIIEKILQDLSVADGAWEISILRYFNPIGADPSGLIGEDPSGKPNNLLPYVAQVAVGKRNKLQIFGNDYDTPDGTGIRDYIHVSDLANGHLAALKKLHNGVEIYNLGSGQGTSVMEIVSAFEKASGKKIPYEVVARRPGDIARCYADPSKAKRELGWQTEKTIEQACSDAWRWQTENPTGYTS